MLARTILACVILLASTTGQRMTSSKMITEDLDSSASGYVYNQQQGLPVYYVRYTNHGSRGYYHAPDAVQYDVWAAAPVAPGVPETTGLLLPYATAEDVPCPTHQGTANYGNEQSLEQPVDSLPRAPYYADGKIRAYEREDTGAEDHGDSEEDDEGDRAVDGVARDGSAGSVQPFRHTSGYDHEGGSNDDGGSSFEGAGEENTAEGYSEGGTKGEKGYETQKKFSEVERRGDHSDREKGHYEKKGVQKKGHVDESEEHGSHEEIEKSKEGGSHGQSSYHRKGEKTNGFHNVYHKDEYKKETDFYDDDHKKGHFEKYEEFDKGYKSDEGDFKEGGHHSSGHDYQDAGKQGHYDKGHSESQDQGHRAEEGEESYYSNQENYGIEEDSKSTKKHKYQEEDR